MISKLKNVAQVTAAIRALEDVRRDRGHRQVKSAQNREEAARLADLYEIRASMWADLGVAADLSDSIPDAYASACSVAIKNDRDMIKYWRTQAGAR